VETAQPLQISVFDVLFSILCKLLTVSETLRAIVETHLMTVGGVVNGSRKD